MTQVKFQDAKLNEAVFVAGRGQYGRVTNIKMAGRHRQTVSVTFENGHEISYSKRTWFAEATEREVSVPALPGISVPEVPLEAKALKTQPGVGKRRVKEGNADLPPVPTMSQAEMDKLLKTLPDGPPIAKPTNGIYSDEAEKASTLSDSESLSEDEVEKSEGDSSAASSEDSKRYCVECESELSPDDKGDTCKYCS